MGFSPRFLSSVGQTKKSKNPFIVLKKNQTVDSFGAKENEIKITKTLTLDRTWRLCPVKKRRHEFGERGDFSMNDPEEIHLREARKQQI